MYYFYYVTPLDIIIVCVLLPIVAWAYFKIMEWSEEKRIKEIYK